jgi:hypothetical protein
LLCSKSNFNILSELKNSACAIAFMKCIVYASE